MLRKLISLLLCLLLLCSMIPAQAEETALPPLFHLYDVTEDGQERLMGSAVLFADSETLLSTVWAMQHAGSVKVIGPDGEYSLASAVCPTPGSELALLTLDRPCTAAAPLDLLASGSAQDMALVLGLNRDGQTVTYAQSDVKPAQYSGYDAALVSAAAGLLPGAITLDEEDLLSGLVTAAWGEKPGYWAALTRKGLAQDFIQAGMVAQEDPSWLKQVSLRYENAMLTVDWSAALDTDEDSQTHVYLIDEGNRFYSWYLVSGEKDSIDLPAAPGRSYGVWVQHKQDTQRSFDTAPALPAARITLDPAQPLTAHSFRNQACYLAFAPAADAPDSAIALPALESITRETLSDPAVKLYLQVIDAYQVAEEIEDALLITLDTPDGQCFSLLSGYIFMPPLNEQDVWNADVTDLIRAPAGMESGLLPGEYVLSYYIGGSLAGQTVFSLE